MRVRPRSALVGRRGAGRGRRARRSTSVGALVERPPTRRSTRVPRLQRRVDRGQRARAARASRALRSSEKSARSRRNGRWTASERIPVERSAAPWRSSPSAPPGRAPTPRRCRPSAVNSCGVGARRPARRCAPRRRAPRRSGPSSVLRRRTGSHHRLEVLERGSSSIVWLTSAPRPAKASPKRRRLACDAVARRLVEDLEELVELDRDARLVERAACRRPRGLLRVPRVSSTYLRPSAERGRTMTLRVDGDLADLLVELEVSSAPVLPSLQRRPAPSRPRRRRGSRPARTSLPLHQVRAVGTLDLELGRRHERQAVVGVVGQEDARRSSRAR